MNLTEAARPATPDDLPAIAELHELARQSVAEARGGAMWRNREARPEPALASFQESLDDPQQLVLVGTLDDAVVGYGAVHLETLADGARLAVIDDLFVHPDGREVGVGEQLMEKITAWANEQGCAGLDARALPGDRHTKNFFESNGLVARAIIVHRALTQPGS